jgi:hypothetical protein
VVGAVARRPVAVAVEPLVARQQPVECRQQVVVRAGADLDDDQPGRGVGYEDRQQPVPAVRRLGDEGGALPGQVEQPATAPRPDRQLARLYGKMLRMASRSRPSPPPAGADS